MAVGSGSSPKGMAVTVRSKSPFQAADLAAAPEQSWLPATSISPALEVTARVAGEGLPALRLPQFAGWHVAQTVDLN